MDGVTQGEWVKVEIPIYHDGWRDSGGVRRRTKKWTQSSKIDY
jgi:hypothetical protein